MLAACVPTHGRSAWHRCVGMLLSVHACILATAATTTALASASVLPKCTSDLDCSLNGVCDKASGVCACDEPWTSNLDGANTLPACGFLRFSKGGSPDESTSQSPAGVFHGVTKQWTSWGTSVVFGKDKQYHAFIAEMANECGLGTWQQNSQVVHAVAATPAGPFKRVDVVVPPLSHNPQVMIAPDGTAVIYTLFDGWSAGVQNCNKTTAAAAAAAAPPPEPPLAAVPATVSARESGNQLKVGSDGVGNCTVPTLQSIIHCLSLVVGCVSMRYMCIAENR